MLRSLKELEKYKVRAVDGDIGRVTDFLFDDQRWTIRYLVTDASGFWERPIQVLISPISFLHVDWATRLFHLGLTKDKIRSSPSVDLSKPVSRQYEHACSQYYGWPFYWGFGDTQGMAAYPTAQSTMKPEDKITAAAHRDPHLRSAKEVAGYHVHGSDGKIGHVMDFIVDDETWTIGYLVIDTRPTWNPQAEQSSRSAMGAGKP
jgi:sporulation protein YlmC with PRC-barrel domain